MGKTIKIFMLLTAKACGLFLFFRFLSKYKVRILCYHGGSIGDEDNFNSLLFCRKETLESRIRWLQKKGFSFISLNTAVSILDNSSPRQNLPVVFTFDDGWYSTYKELSPVLSLYKIPATLYLCTKHFVNSHPISDIVVSYILWKTTQRQVIINGFNNTIDGTYDISEYKGKLDLDIAVSKWIEKNCPTPETACNALEKFASQLGVTANELDLASRRFNYVTREELISLFANNWSIELHGHIHHYPSGQPEVLYNDLLTCKTEIHNSGLPEAKHYCYPSGEHDNTSQAPLEKLGIISAVTCSPGLLSTTDRQTRFYLSRFLDGKSISQLEFEAEMSGFSDFLRNLKNKYKNYIVFKKIKLFS